MFHTEYRLGDRAQHPNEEKKRILSMEFDRTSVLASA